MDQLRDGKKNARTPGRQVRTLAVRIRILAFLAFLALLIRAV